MTVNIAVVIPFYQREHGLLRAALDSVAAQELPDGVRLKIVIVDDESPLPLSEAMEDFSIPAPHDLTVLKQRNGGPGLARNAALNALDPNAIDFVAFLDSDDTWFPGHLRHALSVLKDGPSFYFSNSEHDDKHSFFYSEYIKRHHGFGRTVQPCVRSISGQEAFDAFVDECVPHTSQVVYDFRRHRDTRFDQNQRRAGEDQLFWIALAKNSAEVSYSTSVMGKRGRGISIYREALSWDSEAAPDRLIDEILFRLKLKKLYSFSRERRNDINNFNQLRYDHLFFICLRNIRYRPLVTARAIARIFRDTSFLVVPARDDLPSALSYHHPQS